MHNSDRREKLYEVPTDFSSAMLVTMTDEGEHHGRPMAVADLQPDVALRFATSIASPKIEDIESNPDVCVTFQNSGQFASVNGKARLTRDRELISRLWSPEWKAWFPKGKEDPDIVILEVEPESGAYWDNGGAQGMKYMFETAKALISGTKPGTDDKQHAKVRL